MHILSQFYTSILDNLKKKKKEKIQNFYFS